MFPFVKSKKLIGLDLFLFATAEVTADYQFLGA